QGHSPAADVTHRVRPPSSTRRSPSLITTPSGEGPPMGRRKTGHYRSRGRPRARAVQAGAGPGDVPAHVARDPPSSDQARPGAALGLLVDHDRQGGADLGRLPHLLQEVVGRSLVEENDQAAVLVLVEDGTGRQDALPRPDADVAVDGDLHTTPSVGPTSS